MSGSRASELVLGILSFGVDSFVVVGEATGWSINTHPAGNINRRPAPKATKKPFSDNVVWQELPQVRGTHSDRIPRGDVLGSGLSAPRPIEQRVQVVQEAIENSTTIIETTTITITQLATT